VRIIADKILLSSLLAGSLFLTGCSIPEENTKEEVKPTQASIAETGESSGFFSSWFGEGSDEVTSVKETAETEESSGFFSSWFGDVEEPKKQASNEKKNTIKSSVAKKYPKLTSKQKDIIAKIKIDAEAERKKRIEAVKVGNINAKVVAKIAKKTRLEDVEFSLKEALDVLDEQSKVEEQELAKVMQVELDDQIKSLNIETKNNILKVKSDTKTQRVVAISSVEKKISDTQSEVESQLMKKALATELDRFYLFKENERNLKEQYLSKLSVTKIELDKEREKQLTIMRQNVRAMKQSNQELLNIRASELERHRVAEALEVEKRVKAKNQAMINKLVAKFKAEADEYNNTTRSKLVKQEKAALTQITSKYTKDKSVRDAKEKAYKVGLNAEIVEAKKSAGDKMRSNLSSERDARITTIDNNLESSIVKIYSDRKETLAALESDNKVQYKQRKVDLKAKYEKDRKDLISQSKKDKAKILSRAATRDRDLLIKERREIEAINKKIRSDIKVKSDAVRAN